MVLQDFSGPLMLKHQANSKIGSFDFTERFISREESGSNPDDRSGLAGCGEIGASNLHFGIHSCQTHVGSIRIEESERKRWTEVMGMMDVNVE